MRVKFNEQIYSCIKVTHPKGSKLLLFTTSNGVYTAHMITPENADKSFNEILIHGYCDVSHYEYTN